MEKAFHRAKREGLWNNMMDERYSIPKKLIRIIKNMYSCCIGKGKDRGWESEWFDINTGVRQGDVLSLLLFIVFTDKWARDAGYGHVGRETLMYADDVAVITESVDDLQEVANRWYQAADGNGMK